MSRSGFGLLSIDWDDPNDFLIAVSLVIGVRQRFPMGWRRGNYLGDCLGRMFVLLRRDGDGKVALARPERFELPTYCSGGNRSIQLSYGRAPENYTRGALMAAAGFAAEGACPTVIGMMAGAPSQQRR
jgi:hypothetical protein